MDENHECRYRFAEFRIDTAERRLMRVEQPIALPPKAFDLLILLVTNADRLLTKERIMESLWPAIFVEEANLANVVGLLRKALGDTTRKPAYIETIPKRGYRFIAQVSMWPQETATSSATEQTAAGSAIRFIAFPFRSNGLGGDDFLAQSLPEEIGATLAELNAFTVRSTRMAARFDPVRWDPRAVAMDADVDVILSGTIARAEGQIHATTELIEARSATVLWSKVWDVPVSELHRLRLGIVQLIIRSIIRRTGRPGSLGAEIDTPADSGAYELYLRANGLALKRSPENMAIARDLYTACTEMEPGYAPAWARLGRCCRWLEKFGGAEVVPPGSAEAAFVRAFQLNPNLAIAHSAYTPIQCDAGHAQAAMVRLLGMLAQNDNNPEIFAALVHACRYCGQLQQSIAAHDRAFRLDRNLPTSVTHTYFLLGDYEKALYWYDTKAGMYFDILALTMMGRMDEASALMWTRRERLSMQPAMMHSLRCYLEGDTAGGVAVLRASESGRGGDPEAGFYLARQAARFGDVALALRLLAESISYGYGSSHALMHDPWLENLRDRSEFQQILATARQREQEAYGAFLKAGGDRVLALASAAPSPDSSIL